MKKRFRFYKIVIDFIFISLAIFFAVLLFKENGKNIFTFGFSAKIFLLCVSIIFIHFIKAFRLYIVMFGNNFDLRKFIDLYATTTIVNFLLPFKLGEIYRGFCIGNLLSSFIDGYTIMLFDRFIDTLALLTVIIFSFVFSPVQISPLYVFLFLFLICILFMYKIFENLFSFWNNYLIFKRTSKHTLDALKVLNSCKKIFLYIKNTVQGRFWILYFLSVIAWASELASFLLLKTISKTNFSIGEYLSNMLNGNLDEITFLSAEISMAILCVVKIFCMFRILFSKRAK